MKDGFYWMETPCNPLEVVYIQNGRLFGMGVTKPLRFYEGKWLDQHGNPFDVRQLIGPIDPPFLTGHERQRDAR